MFRQRHRRFVGPARLAAGIAALAAAALAPTEGGLQDLGALIASQPAVSQHWRQHLMASPFGTIHAATFQMPRPLGASVPPPPLYVLASVNPNDVTGALGRELFGDASAPIEFPRVNRGMKRDALIARRRPVAPPLPPLPPPELRPQPPAVKNELIDDRFGDFDGVSEGVIGPPQANVADVKLPYVDLPPTDPAFAKTTKPRSADNEIYFGIDPVDPVRQAIAPWSPGAVPVIDDAADRDAKPTKLASRDVPAKEEGESVARKGLVTGDNQRPLSPAERLKLAGPGRAKAEKCLANAVYFESRGEPVRGQIAVAQVVMNRVFSPFYPNDVCGVVYQNAHRHNACQFTFACDGIPDVVTEPDAWTRATRIARDTLDGKLWMPEIAKATHYHAYWVRPSWIGEMHRLFKLGVHTFYRPRNWGDGSDEPSWGDAEATRIAAEKMQAGN